MNTLSHHIWSFSKPHQLKGFVPSDCNGALWERTPPPESPDFFDRLLGRWSGASIVSGSSERELGAALERLRSALPAELLHDPMITVWMADLQRLALLYAQAAGTPPRLHLLLDTERPCQRFHADNLPLRLVCAYRGAGTLWLSDQNLDRRLAETKGSEERDFVLQPGDARQLREWDVLMMKGRRGSSRPLYHKSPPPDGSPSLLFRVDDMVEVA